jgi:glycosyltransferase involved in cell wall biosynthesis
MLVHGKDQTITLVIPAKNEAMNIATVLARVPDIVDEVVLVDANSTDETVALARSLRPDIVVVYDDEPGKGAALRAGFRAATCDYVVIIDADGSMDPQEIVRYVTLLGNGYELVKGSRFMTGGGSTDITLIRTLGNRGFVMLSNLMFRQRFTDLCYGYLAFDRRRMHDLQLDSVGFEIEAEIIAKSAMNGLRITEVPTFETPRLNGVSNLHALRDGIRILRTLFRERKNTPRVPRPAPLTLDIAPVIDLRDGSSIEVMVTPIIGPQVDIQSADEDAAMGFAAG